MMTDWLIGVYAHSLDDTKRLVEDVECSDCARIDSGVTKHPAWVLGHHALAGDMLVQITGGERTLSAWDARYPNGAPPSAERGAYPLMAELLVALSDRHAEVSRRVAEMGPSELGSMFPIEAYRSFWPTVGDAVAYLMACHEPYHLGQLTQWRLAHGMETKAPF